jgi:hypothetical protein
MAREQEVSVRLYYEDTLAIQNSFLNWIELLIQHKGTIPPPHRKAYRVSLSKSTLEVGRGRSIAYTTKDGTRINLGTFYTFAMLMAYQTKEIVKIEFKGQTYHIPIEELWLTILKKLHEVFPYALNESRHLSGERIRMQAKPGVLEWKPGD